MFAYIKVWPDYGPRYLYTLFVMICQYILPLGLLSFAYVNIAFVIWFKRTPGEPESSRDSRMEDAKFKARIHF